MLVIQRSFERFWPAMAWRRPQIVRNLFLATLILGLLVTHYLEILVWAATLAGIGAFADLRQAFYFAGGAYTTYGSQGVYLPAQWRLLGFNKPPSSVTANMPKGLLRRGSASSSSSIAALCTLASGGVAPSSQI